MNSRISMFAITVGFLLLPTISFAGSSANFHYDELDRLLWVQYDDGTVISYGHDEIGNRTYQNIYTGTMSDLSITVSTIGSGSVSPSGRVLIPSGSTQPVTFYIEPNDSSLLHFYVDGTDVITTLPYVQGPDHPIYHYTIPNETIPVISAPHSLQAVFTANAAESCPDVQVTGTIYTTIQLAINNATSGSTIFSFTRQYNESIHFDRNIPLTLSGGFPCNDGVYGYSTINGSLIVQQGMVTASKIVIK